MAKLPSGGLIVSDMEMAHSILSGLLIVSQCLKSISPNHLPLKGLAMNTKQLVAAVAIALAGSSAMAFEATQFVDAPSTQTRAAVQAANAQAPTAIVTSRGEATQFADVPATADRNGVRAEARAAARAHKFNEIYAG
jgi:hypothetical protein